MALSGHHPPVKGRIRRHYTDVYPRSDKALQGPEATILVHCYMYILLIINLKSFLLRNKLNDAGTCE